eukprot:716779-Prymnesium_polylepis.1
MWATSPCRLADSRAAASRWSRRSSRRPSWTVSCACSISRSVTTSSSSDAVAVADSWLPWLRRVCR